MIRVEIHGDFKVTDVEAEILEHVLSYGFLKEFYEKSSKRFTIEQMDAAVQKMRSQLGLMLRARKAAIAGAQDELNPRPRTVNEPATELKKGRGEDAD